MLADAKRSASSNAAAPRPGADVDSTRRVGRYVLERSVHIWLISETRCKLKRPEKAHGALLTP
jgi:hypothetical protein